jgi:hypothetical protein
MKRYIKGIAILLCLAVLASFQSKAQNNIDQILRDTSNNYYTIKQKADAWFQEKGIVGTGYKGIQTMGVLVKNNIARWQHTRFCKE